MPLIVIKYGAVIDDAHYSIMEWLDIGEHVEEMGRQHAIVE